MYQRGDAGFGQGGGAAVLSLTTPLPPRFRSVAVPQPEPELLDRLRASTAHLDLVVDLGVRIGSRDWWRGLATCTILCTGAVLLRPTTLALPETGAAPLGEAQWEEARALAISPLGYGADTGRRMGATDAVQPLTGTPERPSIDLTATLGQGDGFARALERAGVAEAQARSVAQLVSDAVALDELKPGTRMELTLGRRASTRDARPLDKLAFRARFDLRLELSREGGALRLTRVPIAVDDTPLRIQGRVGASLWNSARAAGASPSAVQAYLRALAGRAVAGSDDRFDLILAHRRAETGETETGELLYAGLDTGKRQLRLLKWQSGGSAEWFEASGVGEKRGLMQMPVAGRITSSFGMRRHPLLGFSRFHKGIDLAAAYGSPIVAATDGVVSYAGWHGGHGKYVMVKHGGGLATGYGHMSRIIAQAGARVRQGQLIGYVGSTGLSTGPHLHYELYRNGAPINPRSVTFTTTSQLAGQDLADFRATLARLLSVRPGAAVAAKPKA